MTSDSAHVGDDVRPIPDYVERLADLLDSCGTENWDSYHAAPVTEQATTMAQAFLDSLWVGPLTNGGIGLSWANECVSIEIDGTGRFTSVCFDAVEAEDLLRRKMTNIEGTSGGQ